MNFRDSILGQPGNLRRSAETFLQALERVDLSQFERVPLVFTGMGASLFAVTPAVRALRAAGRQASAVPPTELLEPGGERLGGAFIGLSQSGESAETNDAFRRISAPRLALTNSGDGPLAEVADRALPIGSDDDTGISVLTYTASILATVALADRLGGLGVEVDVASLSDVMRQAIEATGPVAERLAERLDGVSALDVVGGGPSRSSAGYAALAIREAARVHTASFETRQYLHGPIEVAESGSAAIVLGRDPEVRLARELAGYGVLVLLVTDALGEAGGSEDEVGGPAVLRLPSVADPFVPLLQAVPGQLLAAELARRRGIDPGTLRHVQEDTKVRNR